MSPSAFGLTGSKVVAVVRACGNIVPGTKEKEGNIRAQPLIDKLNKLAEDSSVVGVVLRVDSHGVYLNCSWAFACRLSFVVCFFFFLAFQLSYCCTVT